MELLVSRARVHMERRSTTVRFSLAILSGGWADSLPRNDLMMARGPALTVVATDPWRTICRVLEFGAVASTSRRS